MRRSRTFRPVPLEPLEGRVVLSHVAPAAAVRTIALVPGAPTPGPSSGTAFAQDVHDTVQAGFPTYEQLTTHFSDRSVEVEDRLTVPNHAYGTTTTTAYLSLPHNQGVEKVVDLATTRGGLTTHSVVTSLPDGTTNTEQFTESPTSAGTLALNGTIHRGDGTTQTYIGTVVTQGTRTTTDKTITAADGSISTSHEVLTRPGDLTASDTLTTHSATTPAHTISGSARIVRLNPPQV